MVQVQMQCLRSGVRGLWSASLTEGLRDKEAKGGDAKACNAATEQVGGSKSAHQGVGALC